jgi:hypothetical protein
VVPKFDMRHYNWQNLDADFVEALNRAYDAMPDAAKQSMRANSGYRTETREQADRLGMPHRSSQEDVYARSRGGRAFVAARPGNSSHGRGFAVDIERGPALAWLHKHGREFGLTPITPYSGRDPVHIEAINQPGRGQQVAQAWPRTAPPVARTSPNVPLPPIRLPPPSQAPIQEQAPPVPLPPSRPAPQPGRLAQVPMPRERPQERQVARAGFTGPGSQAATISPGIAEMLTGLMGPPAAPMAPPQMPMPIMLPPPRAAHEDRPGRDAPEDRAPGRMAFRDDAPGREAINVPGPPGPADEPSEALTAPAPKEAPPSRVVTPQHVEDVARPIAKEAKDKVPSYAKAIVPGIDSAIDYVTKEVGKAQLEAVKEDPFTRDAPAKAEKAGKEAAEKALQRTELPSWVKERPETKQGMQQVAKEMAPSAVQEARDMKLSPSFKGGLTSRESEEMSLRDLSRHEARQAPPPTPERAPPAPVNREIARAALRDLPPIILPPPQVALPDWASRFGYYGPVTGKTDHLGVPFDARFAFPPSPAPAPEEEREERGPEIADRDRDPARDRDDDRSPARGRSLDTPTISVELDAILDAANDGNLARLLAMLAAASPQTVEQARRMI